MSKDRFRTKCYWVNLGGKLIRKILCVYYEHICSFFVTFFSATIDDRNLIFGHKLHIGTLYRGKRFLTRQIPTSCLELMLTYDTPALRQTGSRNLTGQKTLPTIWGTYLKLVAKYQISAINSCWEKCDEKWAYMFREGGILFYLCPSVQDIFRRIFLSNCW
jgi:hypothetical protein